MTLKTDIANWDAKQVEVIQAIYDKYSADERFTHSLVAMLNDPKAQRGATWLLKHHIENKHPLPSKHVTQLLRALEIMEHWEAKLHILQCLPFVEISAECADKLHNILKTFTQSDQKFVRAWAYGGLIELSEQYTDYREDSRKIVKKAYDHEAGSVCARIRQASKKRPYWQNIFM